MTSEPLRRPSWTSLLRLTSAASPAPWQAFAGLGLSGPDFIGLGCDDDSPDMYIEHDLPDWALV